MTKTPVKNIAACFQEKLRQDHVPAEFENIVTQVKELIGPIASALTSRKPPPSKWFAPGPWE